MGRVRDGWGEIFGWGGMGTLGVRCWDGRGGAGELRAAGKRPAGRWAGAEGAVGVESESRRDSNHRSTRHQQRNHRKGNTLVVVTAVMAGTHVRHDLANFAMSSTVSEGDSG